MKKTKKFCATALLFSTFSVVFYVLPVQSQPVENTLVVATYNIDGKVYGRAAEQSRLLENLNVDLVGLQEVNHHNRRFKQLKSYDALEYFNKEYFKHQFFGEMSIFAHGGWGMALLSRYKISNTKNIHLVSDETSVYKDEVNQIFANYDPNNAESVRAFDSLYEPDGPMHNGAVAPKSYIHAVVNKNGMNIDVYVAHPSFESMALRQQQFKTILEDMDNCNGKYKILLADTNADQDTHELDIFRANYRLANGGEYGWIETFHDKDPMMKVLSIDNIIVSKNIEISDVKAIQSTLSDHYPLVATLILK
ncbi:endonuclease/exonuclease/phosphatase family protein [Proteus mirabilis]|uniref:endonuclease/exonuclease/phosphatase family protein n=1 Tax=Proteus mirabilis TaxID=584 RepID=UPI003D2E5159